VEQLCPNKFVTAPLAAKSSNATTITSPIDSRNSSNLDGLAVNFSKNLCLHSTPRNSHENKSDEDCTLTQSQSLRPRRKCGPKVLLEPSLSGKLRNEESKRETKRKRSGKMNIHFSSR